MMIWSNNTYTHFYGPKDPSQLTRRLQTFLIPISGISSLRRIKSRGGSAWFIHPRVYSSSLDVLESSWHGGSLGINSSVMFRQKLAHHLSFISWHFLSEGLLSLSNWPKLILTRRLLGFRCSPNSPPRALVLFQIPRWEHEYLRVEGLVHGSVYILRWDLHYGLHGGWVVITVTSPKFTSWDLGLLCRVPFRFFLFESRLQSYRDKGRLVWNFCSYNHKYSVFLGWFPWSVLASVHLHHIYI